MYEVDKVFIMLRVNKVLFNYYIQYGNSKRKSRGT